ncbi:MAG: hypothetical protein N3A61_08400 [Ignavibacteria bacterium]|nr:hypothetical protein [Ignavibacteria bacterium]
MDFIKFYLVQVLKSASSKIKITVKEKERVISKLISKLEDSTDIFPELKTMERVKGLEEIADKLLNIYRRLNKAHIEIERISYQFCDDRDRLISIIRRFVQGTVEIDSEKRKTPRPKIVFDDTTLTFYEIKSPEQEDTQEESTTVKDEEKLDIAEFLVEETPKLVEVTKSEEILQEKEQVQEEQTLPKEENEVHTFNEFEPQAADESLTEQETTEEKIEIIPEKSPEHIEQIDYDSINLELPFEYSPEEVHRNNIEIQQMSAVDMDEKGIEEEIESKDEMTEITPPIEDFLVNDEIIEIQRFKRENLDESNKSKEEKSEEEEYLEFEASLTDNIKLLDEYLNYFTSGKSNSELEDRIIKTAYKDYLTAEKLGHDVISKLIKTFWLAMAAIRDKKLSATRNEAELIRSTLIIIVALIKNKDLNLDTYWENHKILVNKLNDLKYEV